MSKAYPEKEKRYFVTFKNQHTGETLDFGECAVVSWDRHRVHFENANTGANHFLDLYHSLVDVFINMEYTNASKDTWYYDVRIIALKSEKFEELWNEVW